MRTEIQILILSLFGLWFTACTTRQPNCDFDFQIDAHIYQYDSRTGKLKKLIDPFSDDSLQVYADTVLLLTEENICSLAELCRFNSLENFPDSLVQEIENEVFLGQSCKFSFSNGELLKTVVWENGYIPSTKEETIIISIFLTIDSLLTNSKEFKALPEIKYILE